jgi:hypothetical protein
MENPKNEKITNDAPDSPDSPDSPDTSDSPGTPSSQPKTTIKPERKNIKSLDDILQFCYIFLKTKNREIFNELIANIPLLQQIQNILPYNTRQIQNILPNNVQQIQNLLPNNAQQIQNLLPQLQSIYTYILDKVGRKLKCSECNKIRIILYENRRICYSCYRAKEQSGNKVIDDFIGYTQINCPNKNGKMIFVPYDKFKNIELIGEGGFSKIYKATWINYQMGIIRNKSKTVALKKLEKTKNITSKELNEVNIPVNFVNKL